MDLNSEIDAAWTYELYNASFIFHSLSSCLRIKRLNHTFWNCYCLLSSITWHTIVDFPFAVAFLPWISPQLTQIMIVNNWDVINLIRWAYDLHNVHNILLFQLFSYGMISRRLDQEQNQWTSEYYCSKRLPRNLAEIRVNDDFIDGTRATATLSQELTC